MMEKENANKRSSSVVLSSTLIAFQYSFRFSGLKKTASEEKTKSKKSAHEAIILSTVRASDRNWKCNVKMMGKKKVYGRRTKYQNVLRKDAQCLVLSLELNESGCVRECLVPLF
jgi:hypothetical protein